MQGGEYSLELNSFSPSMTARLSWNQQIQAVIDRESDQCSIPNSQFPSEQKPTGLHSDENRELGIEHWSDPARPSGQSEHNYRESCGDGNVLLAVNCKRHGSGTDSPSQLNIPEWLSGLVVEREKVAFLAAAEHESSGRR